MGLLHKRPLALFCTCFLVALYASSYFLAKPKLIIGVGLIALALIVLILAVFHRKKRLLWITVIVCILAASLAFLHMYLRMDRRQEKALAYTGERSVECQILSETYLSDGHSEYVAEILQIGEERIRIRTYLVCGFWGELHPGDRFVARVELLEPDERTYGISANDRVSDPRILLATVLYDAEDGQLVHCAKEDTAWILLSSPNGMELLSDRMRATTASVFDRCLGEKISPLARSFFIGDKSDLSPRIVRDFCRTGASHLLAVSGLHIAILLGGLEWILRKLTLAKKLRIVIVSMAGILLLMVTGFSMSACRSVLMLFAVYLHFLFAKENDPLTSLLVAVSGILVLSPYAFFDLGLWMSFWATLGLLSVYPMLDARIPRKCFQRPWARLGYRIARGACMIALMSAVTGLFLLPIQWSVFREISLVSIPANLAVSSLATLFLYVIPIVLLFSQIPIFGTWVCYGLCALGDTMTGILGFFSEQNFAMLSMRYVFADVIIPVLALCMVVLLLIRLRHRWILVIPPVLAAICFAACLMMTFYKEPPIVTDYTNGDQRYISVVENGEALLLDLSCERVGAYFDGAKSLRDQGATDIDALILGHLSENHPEMLSEFLEYTVVHRIYLPYSLVVADYLLADEVGEVAESAGCEVLVYGDEIAFSPIQDLFMQGYVGSNDSMVAWSMACDGRRVTYVDPTRMPQGASDAYRERMQDSHTVFLSFEECDGESTYEFSLEGGTVKQIVMDRAHDHACVSLDAQDISVIRYSDDHKKRVVSFFLEP